MGNQPMLIGVKKLKRRKIKKNKEKIGQIKGNANEMDKISAKGTKVKEKRGCEVYVKN